MGVAGKVFLEWDLDVQVSTVCLLCGDCTEVHGGTVRDCWTAMNIGELLYCCLHGEKKKSFSLVLPGETQTSELCAFSL